MSLLDNLARFVADNSGKVFSANSIAKYLKGSAMAVSANTVGEYMDVQLIHDSGIMACSARQFLLEL